MQKVLIFDDNEEILLVMEMILSDAGYSVFTRTDVNTVIQAVEETQPDVVIMDNNIPDHGGILASQQIKSKAEHQHIPIIFCTSSDRIKALAEQAKAQTSLNKPFDIDTLLDTVKACLA